jgi:hypothetical protein
MHPIALATATLRHHGSTSAAGHKKASLRRATKDRDGAKVISELARDEMLAEEIGGFVVDLEDPMR